MATKEISEGDFVVSKKTGWTYEVIGVRGKTATCRLHDSERIVSMPVSLLSRKRWYADPKRLCEMGIGCSRTGTHFVPGYGVTNLFGDCPPVVGCKKHASGIAKILGKVAEEIGKGGKK